MKEGNGDPNLCLFPEKVTPNHHKLARQFVLLDNFYCDGEVSADGHQWSMGAYATDFVEKVWPLTIAAVREEAEHLSVGRRLRSTIARPAGGYIWDRCDEAKVSYRSYGEWIENGKKPSDPAQGPASRHWRATSTRVSRLRSGLSRPEAGRPLHRGAEPLREGRRHAAAARSCGCPTTTPPARKVGKPTPTAMVADNDLALGRVVEAVSQEQVLEGDGHLRHRGRRPERPRSRRRPPHRRPGHQPVHEARHRRFDDVFDEQHVADDGADPRPEADEPVRRGGHADVPLLPEEAGLCRLQARRARSRPEGEEQGDGLGREAVGDVRPDEGGPGGRSAVQRGDLAFGEGGRTARCRRRCGRRS